MTFHIQLTEHLILDISPFAQTYYVALSILIKDFIETGVPFSIISGTFTEDWTEW